MNLMDDARALYDVLLITQIASSLLIFILLFFVNAPYGKYYAKRWGASINPRLGWIAMEFPAFITLLVMFIAGGAYKNFVLTVFIVIWEIHYIRRTFIFPFQIITKKKMSVLIPILSVVFNTMNGYINGYYLFINDGSFEKYSFSWIFTPQFIVGCSIFIVGLVININSDSILRKLRLTGDGEYYIPNEGLHKYVANPNYFGELLEWIGWAVLTWSPAGAAFALFTFANLSPRAQKNKLWYREKFGSSYPKERKAIIPYLF